MSTQSTASVNPTSQAQKEGRDASGRFTAGNRGGPGNPFKRQVAGIRQALIKSISEEEIQSVGRKLLELSLEGNVPAAKLLFEYVIGKPLPAPEPDRMDVDEWEGFQETACMKAEAAALSNVGEPEFHLNFVRNARPIVTTLMQEQMVAVANETPERQQELAADDLAASALADRNQYLKALASLALRAPARMSAGAMPWSAMTGGTLLRRIHMLRGTQTGRPLGLAMRGLLVGVLAGIGVLLMTLGSPATAPDRPVENPDAFEIGYLSPDVKAFVALRPAFLLRQPGMEKASRTMADGLLELKKLGLTVPDALKPENIEELVMDLHLTSKGTGEPRSRSLMVASSSLYLRLNQDFDWPAFLKSLSKEAGALTGKAGFEVTEIRDEGMTLYRTGAIPLVSPAPIYFYMPDRRSVVFSGFLRTAGDPQTDAKAFRQLIENAATARQRNWGGYTKVARAPIATVVDNQDQHYTKMLSKDLETTELKMLENIRFATVGIEVGEGRPVRLILDAKSAAHAPELQKAVDIVALSLREKIRQAKPDDEQNKIALKLATELLQDHKLNREGARLEWVGFSSVRIHDLLERHDEKTPSEQTKSRTSTLRFSSGPSADSAYPR